jgi:outer membrane protein TolC
MNINTEITLHKNLRRHVVTGVITASEYITELAKLYETENLFNQHKTQLELAKANYNILMGDTK